MQFAYGIYVKYQHRNSLRLVKTSNKHVNPRSMVFTLDELQILITRSKPQIKYGIYSNLHPINSIKSLDGDQASR